MQPTRASQPTLANSTGTPAPRPPEAQTKNALAVGTAALSAASVKNEVFTGEQSPVDRFAERINASWHKTSESIFDLASVCAQAEKELSPAAKKALIARLPFDRVTFSKLATIGNDARLRPLMRQLPSSFSTLYELSRFDETQLASGLKTGAINSHATRQEIIDFGKALSSDQKSASARKTASRPAKSCLEELKSYWKRASDADKQSFGEWRSNGCPDA